MSSETLSREAVALIKLGETVGQLGDSEELLREARDQCYRLRRDRLAITRAYDDVCQKLDKAIDALEYIAGLDSSQAACAELCSAVGVAVKALEDME